MAKSIQLKPSELDILLQALDITELTLLGDSDIDKALEKIKPEDLILLNEVMELKQKLQAGAKSA